MPIVSNDLGPGTLTLGAGPLDVSAQLTSCTLEVSESVSSGTEGRKVLSGESLPGTDGEATFSYALSGTFLQDLQVGGVVEWSWANKGEPEPFTFEPNSAQGTAITGVLYPVPLNIGGEEVDATMESDFTWRCQGEPVPTFAA